MFTLANFFIFYDLFNFFNKIGAGSQTKQA